MIEGRSFTPPLGSRFRQMNEADALCLLRDCVRLARLKGARHHEEYQDNLDTLRANGFTGTRWDPTQYSHPSDVR